MYICANPRSREALQWTYVNDEHGPANDPNLLFVNFGEQAAHRQTLLRNADEFRQIHGSSPLTKITGFCPWRSSQICYQIFSRFGFIMFGV